MLFIPVFSGILKTNTTNGMTVEFICGTPKLSTNSTLNTLWNESYNDIRSTLIDGTTLGSKTSHCAVLNRFFSMKTKKFYLLPGATKVFTVQGPKNWTFDPTKYTTEASTESAPSMNYFAKCSATKLYMIRVLNDISNSSNGVVEFPKNLNADPKSGAVDFYTVETIKMKAPVGPGVPVTTSGSDTAIFQYNDMPNYDPSHDPASIAIMNPINSVVNF